MHRFLWEVPFRVFMRKNFIFTNKKHSSRAIMATILGIISIAALIAVVFMTYMSAGEAPVGYGVTGLLATVFSIIGLGLGIVTFQDRQYYRVFPVLGIGLNLIALGAVSLILYVGANL